MLTNTCFGDLGHFSADSGEFGSGHGDDGVVVGFGDGELFRVDGQQVKVEFRNLISLYDRESIKRYIDVFLLAFSKIKVMEEGSSSAFMEMISSLPAHFMILERFWMLRPKVMFLRALKLVKPFSLRFKATRATWEESIAWMERPAEETSMLTVLTNSLMASMIFLRTIPCSSLAWNMF